MHRHPCLKLGQILCLNFNNEYTGLYQHQIALVSDPDTPMCTNAQQIPIHTKADFDLFATNDCNEQRHITLPCRKLIS